jgi:ribose/xylose/arabinose/galactoside ABC-type transport system permease subunit
MPFSLIGGLMGKNDHNERKCLDWRTIAVKYGLLLIVLLTVLIFSLLEPRFYSPINIFNIIRQSAVYGILALGLGLVIVNGDFDMSFPAAVSLVGVTTILLIMNSVNPVLVFFIGIGLGLAIGVLNALLVVYARIPAFIATLGVMTFLQGLAKYVTGGAEIYPTRMPAFFKLFGSTYTFGIIPNSVFTFLIIGVAAIILFDYSKLGRYMYASGSNPDAARHVGINVKFNRTLAFVISGLLSGVSGLLLVSMLRAANPTIGSGYMFPVIMAVFLGALFLRAGVVNAPGIMVAAVFTAILANGFTMIGLPFYAKDIASGLILVLALLMICMLGRNPMRNITM